MHYNPKDLSYNSSILLSICIPTFNRSIFISEMIEGLFEQITDDIKDKIEICISENPSSDKYGELIEKLRKISPVTIKYHQNTEQIGFDRNLIQSIKMAKGNYCWLFSDDDKMTRNAVETVLTELRKDKKGDIALFYCNSVDCNSNLEPVKIIYSFNNNGKDLYDFSKFDDIINFYNNSRQLFGFLSACIINRKIFNKINIDEDKELIGTNYIQTYINFKMLHNGYKMKYINVPLVYHRFACDNDSFDQNGKFIRILMDIESNYKIAKKIYFKNIFFQQKFLNILKKWSRPSFDTLLECRENSENDIWDKNFGKFIKSGYPESIVAIVGFLFRKINKETKDNKKNNIDLLVICAIKKIAGLYFTAEELFLIKRYNVKFLKIVNGLRRESKVFFSSDINDIAKRNIKKIFNNEQSFENFLNQNAYSNIYTTMPLNLSLFKINYGGKGFLDKINNSNESIIYNNKNNIRGSGWIADNNLMPAKKIFILFISYNQIKYFIEANLIFRLDVKIMVPFNTNGRFGYNFLIPSDVLLNGTYDIYTIYIRDDRMVIFNNNKKIVINQNMIIN